MIRLAVEGDIPAIRRLADEGDSEFSAAPEIFRDGKFEDVLGYLANDSVLVAETETGMLCGFVCVGVSPGKTLLGNLIVSRKCRGKRIGAQLVSAAHDLGKSRGGSTALVVIWSDKGLDRFYESVGYRKIGHLLEMQL